MAGTFENMLVIKHIVREYLPALVHNQRTTVSFDRSVYSFYNLLYNVTLSKSIPFLQQRL